MLDRLLIHLDEKKRLGPLTEDGAFAIMQSYDLCLLPEVTLENLEDIDMDLEQIDGVLYWIAENYEYYCKLNAETGEMEEYDYMEG